MGGKTAYEWLYAEYKKNEGGKKTNISNKAGTSKT